MIRFYFHDDMETAPDSLLDIDLIHIEYSLEHS